LLARQFPDARSLTCLQVVPDDPTEAEQLRTLGHVCTMTEPTSGPTPTLAFPDASQDFVFTGRFTGCTAEPAAQRKLAREFHRVLRPGGALLVLIGNRWCPLDLSRNGPLVHGPGSRATLAYRECIRLFVREAGFASIEHVNLAGHFGWARLPTALRPIGKLLDAHWRHLATPARNWLYTSPLNPTFLLWLTKH